MKKRNYFLIVLMTVMMVMLFATSAFAAAKPKLSKRTATLKAGKTLTLTLKNAKKAQVRWSSSNKKIATVSKGEVIPKKNGTVKIKAKYKGKTYSCTVKVKGFKTNSNSSGNTKTVTVGHQKDKSYLDKNGNFKKSLVKKLSESEFEKVNVTLGKDKLGLGHIPYGNMYTAIKVGSDYYYISPNGIDDRYSLPYSIINGERYYHQYKGLTNGELTGETMPSPLYEHYHFGFSAKINTTASPGNIWSLNSEAEPTCTYNTVKINPDTAQSQQEYYGIFENAYNTNAIVVGSGDYFFCFPGKNVPAGTKYTVKCNFRGLKLHVNFIVKNVPQKGTKEYNDLARYYDGFGLQMLK